MHRTGQEIANEDQATGLTEPRTPVGGEQRPRGFMPGARTGILDEGTQQGAELGDQEQTN